MLSYCGLRFGSALGGTARHWCSGVAAKLIGGSFPWGTLIVNVSGSLAIGLIAALADPDGRLFVGGTARQFLIVGLLGGFTTFSAFSLQTLELMHNGAWLNAGVNIAASVVLCLIGVWLGHLAGVSLNGLKWV
jgi:CrcB protein